MGHYCELSVGTQIAVNNAAPSGERVAVVGLVACNSDIGIKTDAM
jgi:hypothetical protein